MVCGPNVVTSDGRKNSMKRIRLWIGEAGARLAAWSGSPAPTWHTPTELYDYLRHQNYSQVIAEELAAKYAENLQRSFAKGYSFGLRKAKQKK